MKLRSILAVAALFALAALVVLPPAPQAQEVPAPTGFQPARVAGQLSCEAQLMSLPRPEQFREHLRIITQDPHPAGSEAQRRVEQYLVDVMSGAGLEVQRYPYDVYLPQLTDDVTAEIITPEHITLSTQEGELAEDRFSGHPDLLNGWNAYSGSGDVTGNVVYANFGRKEDFEQLREWGVQIEGQVVVARYGGNFRGYKVKFAQEYGAIGVIMFNDPGANIGIDEYPSGPNMNSTTIQRGSVLTLDYTGDPLTPFEPAYTVESGKPVNRLDPADVDLHKIPVLPMGYGAAKQILDRMTGEAAPEDWHGGIPTTYRITGGDDLTVRVQVNQPKALTRAVNVVGMIPGTEFPDEWVMFGAHYDPWGFGAIDPNGGTAMLLTMAEALGELAANGCAPRRSIMIGHWDAEEYGIIGSAEYVEEVRDELTNNAIAYINADSAVSGPNFGASSSPSLKAIIVEATRAVEHPTNGMTVYGTWLRAGEGDVPRMGNLGGGGSDHVGFYSHVGVPSGSLGFGGGGGVYHSNYDNFAWYERFGDHEFIFGPTLARVNGVLGLRLANADVLPYDVTRYARDLATHTNTIEELAHDAGMTAELSGLREAIAGLQHTAARYEIARDGAVLDGDFPADELRALNAMLIGLEKAFVHEEGLQGRPWYRSLYASPDPFSGYASWMLPGLRYEVETDNEDQLAFWETVYVEAVQELTARVEKLRAGLDE
jgi:N-acetylated-alpha-linked acidic dipeptidase